MKREGLFIRLSTFFLCSLCLLTTSLRSQELARVSGRVVSDRGEAVAYATVSVRGGALGVVADSTGYFSFKINGGQDYRMRFAHAQYLPTEIALTLIAGQDTALNVVLAEKIQTLEDVTIRSFDAREQAGLYRLDPATIKEVPTPFMDFNQALITAGMGIVGNNELSSAYSVRGGSFEENLVYVNNIEVYRPFLVRAGEQEGLSFINPEMVGSISFASGGWQAKYGDKLSSVLNVTYKEPKRASASVVASLLGGSAHVEGQALDGRFSYVAGVRHKSSRYLLNTLEVDGQYLPRFTDFQTYLRYDISHKDKPRGTTTLGLLANYARNRYEVTPESRTTRFGTFQQVLSLRVRFAGDESLEYDTFQSGLKLSHKWNSRFSSEFIASGMRTLEREYINLEAGYQICDINTNVGSPGFNECSLIRGMGTNFDYARNSLSASILSFENRNRWKTGEKSLSEFGFRLRSQRISDRLDEYTFFDSANFVTPTGFLRTDIALNTFRLSGYYQHSWFMGEEHTLTAGFRFNYLDLNQEWLFSPRAQYAFAPNWQRDVVFNASVGLYHQPPFYRELRNFQGEINPDLRGQKSFHAIVGMDHNFMIWGRPFKFISELYYKNMWDVVPYDVDNVRLRYYATNNATALAYGTDLRLSGEFIPGTESWFNLGLMRVTENLGFDGRGDVRRPTDQRLTFSMFFEDHFPNDPSMRMHIRMLYGTGLPYGPPNNLQFRQALSAGTVYNRVDLGFSKLITFGRPQSSDNDLRTIENIWIGLEVLNFFGANNNISFTWLSDFNNLSYAVPNSLSQRFFNLRTIVRF